MTYFQVRGSSTECQDIDSAADTSVGEQEAALVWELRRLQKFLDQEREERARFPRAVDLQSSNRHPRNQRREESVSAESADGAVSRFLDRFGLTRRKPVANRTRPRGNASAVVRQSGRHDVKPPSLSQHAQNTDRMPLSSTAASIGTDRGHSSARHDIRVLPQISASDRVANVSVKMRRSLPAGRTIRSDLFQRLQSAYTFLSGRAHTAALEKCDGKLTARLACAYEGELKTGLRVLIIGVGIVGGWAALVPLSGAVMVPGTLVVESDVKKIQHPTGGVVAKIPVHNGMHVRAGDLLLHLDETQPRANAQVLVQQLDQVRVRLARLIAERDGLDEPRVPHEMAGRPGDDDLNRLWASEMSLFKSRKAARHSAKQLLQNRSAQLGEQISGLDAQVKSKAAQHELIAGELEGVESLYQKGLVPLARKTSLQREAARLDGERGQAAAAIAETKSKISETELQVIRVDQDFRTEVMKDLREAQDKEAELVEKTTAARDLLGRVDLRAPTNGIVHELSAHTIGGVVTPGEVIMEIVPESDELQVEARLPPQDIDHVHTGQRAYIRFSAFNQRTTPQLEGVVSYVSADLNRDKQKGSNAAYYTVRATLPSSERRRLGGLQLVSGMPVEVFLQTGSRTMMSYLLKPITDQLLRTFN